MQGIGWIKNIIMSLILLPLLLWEDHYLHTSYYVGVILGIGNFIFLCVWDRFIYNNRNLKYGVKKSGTIRF